MKIRACVLTVIFVFVTAAWGITDPPAGRLRLSGDASSAWILGPEGDLRRVEIESGRSLPETTIQEILRGAADIALSSDGQILYGLVPAANGKTTELVAITLSTWQESGRWVARGRGRFVEIAPDGYHACIVGLRPGAGKRQSRPKPEDWTLTVFDLKAGQDIGRPVIGLEPHALVILRGPSREPRVHIAGKDRITTYSIAPTKPARFFRSPGENWALTGLEGSSSLYLLRDSAFVVIDPARWKRQGGLVQLGDDDATSVVPLPAQGRDLRLTADGSVAVVLHGDGMALSLVDTQGGQVIETRELAKQRDYLDGPVIGEPRQLLLASAGAPDRSGHYLLETFLAPRILSSPPPAAPVVIAEPSPEPEGTEPEEIEETIAETTRHDDPPDPEAEEPSAPAPEPSVTEPEEIEETIAETTRRDDPPDPEAEEPSAPAPEPAVTVPEEIEGTIAETTRRDDPPDPEAEEPSAPAPEPPVTVPEEIEGTIAETTRRDDPPDPEAEEPSAPAPESAVTESEEIEETIAETTRRGDPPDPEAEEPTTPAPEPAEASDPPGERDVVLEGELSGEFAAADQVLLYGPNNIVKLHGKAVVQPDGTFSFPLPPPGRYRLVVSGGASGHVFTKPEYRAIVVQEGAGIQGLDFEVRGKL